MPHTLSDLTSLELTHYMHAHEPFGIENHGLFRWHELQTEA